MNRLNFPYILHYLTSPVESCAIMLFFLRIAQIGKTYTIYAKSAQFNIWVFPDEVLLVDTDSEDTALVVAVDA
jgi:hypothetical protein